LGAFIHDYRGEKFITKISKYTHKNNGAGREETFYKNICADFPQLNTIVPQYVDSLVLDKISYLTIEMIDTISEHPTANHIQKIMGHHRRSLLFHMKGSITVISSRITYSNSKKDVLFLLSIFSHGFMKRPSIKDCLKQCI